MSYTLLPFSPCLFGKAQLIMDKIKILSTENELGLQQENQCEHLQVGIFCPY